MPARSFSKGTDHAAQYPRRPYDNQYHRFCSVCNSHTLHTKGRKYWTCLTCDTRTERHPPSELETRPANCNCVGWLALGRHSYECLTNESKAEAKNAAAQALRAIPSEKRAQASRENGKKGGRPKKTQE